MYNLLASGCDTTALEITKGSNKQVYTLHPPPIKNCSPVTKALCIMFNKKLKTQYSVYPTLYRNATLLATFE